MVLEKDREAAVSASVHSANAVSLFTWLAVRPFFRFLRQKDWILRTARFNTERN